MIPLLMIIAWMIPTLITFRYTGYANNIGYLEGPHSSAIICTACKCTRCGHQRTEHLYGRRSGVCAKSYETAGGWEGMHTSAVVFGFLEALIWPITWLAYGIKLGAKSTGLSEVTFYKPPPEIQSREERRAKREAEKDERMRALEKRNSELERQLGIGA